jgi:aminoglycoside 6'-N-acetyltransferase I
MILDLANRLTIRTLQVGEEPPYQLLLLADETKEAIDKYIYDSEVFVCEIDTVMIAAYVLKIIDHETAEIKNIAVDKTFQGNGIGTYLLESASKNAATRNCKFLLIGTGDKSERQLQLYRRTGFRDSAIIKDFFLVNYPDPIFENGAQLKDMIVLKKALSRSGNG